MNKHYYMINRLKNLRLHLSDTWEVLSGKRNPMVPPKRIVNINGGDDIKIGETFLKYFIEHGDLGTKSDILDVGSGFGRMAVPLTGFLSTKCRYEGIELIPDGVDWCTKKITSKFNNFKFRKIDVKNGRYNPNGKFSASEYKFPFDDQSFDFIILTSVFTHMLPSDLENYLSEISRVLRPNGKCFITYFLLNNESISLVENGKSTFNLKYNFEDCRIENEEDPEYVIAYNEKIIIDLYRKYNLKITSSFYGSWCGRFYFTDFQDIVIGVK